VAETRHESPGNWVSAKNSLILWKRASLGHLEQGQPLTSADVRSLRRCRCASDFNESRQVAEPPALPWDQTRQDRRSGGWLSSVKAKVASTSPARDGRKLVYSKPLTPDAPSSSVNPRIQQRGNKPSFYKKNFRPLHRRRPAKAPAQRPPAPPSKGNPTCGTNVLFYFRVVV
jgi:hypothetical protein